MSQQRSFLLLPCAGHYASSSSSQMHDEAIFSATLASSLCESPFPFCCRSAEHKLPTLYLSLQVEDRTAWCRHRQKFAGGNCGRILYGDWDPSLTHTHAHHSLTHCNITRTETHHCMSKPHLCTVTGVVVSTKKSPAQYRVLAI